MSKHLTYEGANVLRWNIERELARRGWTAYKLSIEAGIASPVAYRIARDAEAPRVDADTLERICKALGLGISDVLRIVPDETSNGAKRKKR